MISVEEAHRKYEGAQDRYDASTHAATYPCVSEVVESCKESVPAFRRKVIYLPSEEKQGIANLRITGDWERAELEVGCQRFETIRPFMGCDGFWYMQGDRAFPWLSYHDLRIFVDAGPAGATVSWDRVTVDRFSPMNAAEIYAIGHQYTGTETLTRDQSTIRLNINHPVFSVYVKTDKPVKRLQLQLNEALLDIPFIWKDRPKHWEATFQGIPADGVPISSMNTINFSRIHSVSLHIEHDHDTVEVDAWATTSQLTRIMAGMAGLAFSK